MIQRPWKRHDNTHQHHNDGEYHGAERMVRKSIQNLGAGEDVEPDEENVVCKQHKAAELVCNSVLSKNVVSKIACRANSLEVRSEETRGKLFQSSRGSNLQISLIWGFFMMYLCIVIEVIQKRTPASTMVIIPGTHPRTLERTYCQFRELWRIAMSGENLRK
jgi:hypothetical protein